MTTGKYLFALYKKDPLSLLFKTVPFVIIFSVIAMFMTVGNAPAVNQKIFLDNSGHSFIVESENGKYSVADLSIVSGLLEDGNSFSFKEIHEVKLYLTDQQASFDSNSYFTRDNLLSGSIGEGIALSYNVSKRLGIKKGDEVELYINSSSGNPDIVKVRVEGILRTMYPDCEIDYGIGLMTMTEEIKSVLENNDSVISNISFLNEKSVESAIPKYMEYFESKSKGHTDLFNKTNAFLIAASLILISLFLLKQLHRDVKSRSRDIAVMSALGLENRSILRIFILEELVILLTSGILAMFIYKFILMDFFIGQYAGIGLTLKAFTICMTMGIVVTILGISRAKKNLASIEIIDLLSGKKELI